jgi:alcohol dehydrogenase class IV
MIRSELSVPGRIILGPGTSAELPSLLRGIGQRALLVVSAGAARRGGAAALLADQLLTDRIAVAQVGASGEPESGAVENAAQLAKESGCDCVVAIGGGSVIDTAKAAAALATNPGGALEYMEVVGAGKALAQPALPVVAVPTTAGAGSEATRNAVVRSPEHGAKASIRHGSMLPRIALVDSALTVDLPADVTAACGMDALTQLVEAFVSKRAGHLTDGFCREGMLLAIQNLRQAVKVPDDLGARSAMSAAALLSGMALANAGLGAVHGIAAPLGGQFPAPHGTICAALLAPITAANLTALRHRAPSSLTLRRYAEVAAILGADDINALPDLLAALAQELGIPGLASYGLKPAGVPGLALLASQSSSTRSNPVELTLTELEQAIGASL